MLPDALKPLLSLNGGSIRSSACVGPFVAMMKTEADLFQRITYLNILSRTHHSSPLLVQEFFLGGGAQILGDWLRESIETTKETLIVYILQVLDTVPISTEALGQTELARDVKKLKKSKSERVVTIANSVFEKWMRVLMATAPVSLLTAAAAAQSQSAAPAAPPAAIPANKLPTRQAVPKAPAAPAAPAAALPKPAVTAAAAANAPPAVPRRPSAEDVKPPPKKAPEPKKEPVTATVVLSDALVAAPTKTAPVRRNANNPNRPAGTARTDEEVASAIAKRNYQLPKAIMLDEFEPPTRTRIAVTPLPARTEAPAAAASADAKASGSTPGEGDLDGRAAAEPDAISMDGSEGSHTQSDSAEGRHSEHQDGRHVDGDATAVLSAAPSERSPNTAPSEGSAATDQTAAAPIADSAPARKRKKKSLTWAPVLEQIHMFEKDTDESAQPAAPAALFAAREHNDHLREREMRESLLRQQRVEPQRKWASPIAWPGLQRDANPGADSTPFIPTLQDARALDEPHGDDLLPSISAPLPFVVPFQMVADGLVDRRCFDELASIRRALNVPMPHYISGPSIAVGGPPGLHPRAMPSPRDEYVPEDAGRHGAGPRGPHELMGRSDEVFRPGRPPSPPATDQRWAAHGAQRFSPAYSPREEALDGYHERERERGWLGHYSPPRGAQPDGPQYADSRGRDHDRYADYPGGPRDGFRDNGPGHGGDWERGGAGGGAGWWGPPEADRGMRERHRDGPRERDRERERERDREREPKGRGAGPSRAYAPCRFFSSPGGCRNGTSCKFSHN